MPRITTRFSRPDAHRYDSPLQDDASKLRVKIPDQLLYRNTVKGCHAPNGWQFGPASQFLVIPNRAPSPVRNLLFSAPLRPRYTLSMPAKRKFEEQLAALDALRQHPPEATL